MQNGNEKRQRETATRSGNEKRQREAARRASERGNGSKEEERYSFAAPRSHPPLPAKGGKSASDAPERSLKAQRRTAEIPTAYVKGEFWRSKNDKKPWDSLPLEPLSSGHPVSVYGPRFGYKSMHVNHIFKRGFINREESNSQLSPYLLSASWRKDTVHYF